MSLRERISRAYNTSKKRREERKEKERALHEKVEAARMKGYEREAIVQARKQGRQQARTKSSGGKLAAIGAGAFRGLDFLNEGNFGFGLGEPSKPRQRKKQKKTTRKKKQSQPSSIFDLF